jgi:predicted glycogen debranching enzyme
MAIFLDRNIMRDFTTALHREWLETNGLGGWASSTISGAHSRRYHGLLVAATQPPVGRMVLLSKLDETVVIDGQRHELSCNAYPAAIHPRGYELLESFTKDLFPVFVYQAAGIRLRKTIAAIHGENTTLVVYEVLQAPSAFGFELLPLVAGRDAHALTHANDAIRREAHFRDGIFQVQPYDGVPELFIAVPGAGYEARPDWFFNFQYALEQERGLDFSEDLFCYGSFRLTLRPGDKLALIISTENPAGRDAFNLLEWEEHRRQGHLARMWLRDEVATTLTLAADQFVVQRGQESVTVIAGYHWFSDWGRDTMIALPGLTLVTGRFQEAAKILRAFAASVSQGMLPNRFPDVPGEPEYNSVDAALWFFVATYEYFQYTGNMELVQDELLPVLEEIVAWHDRGTRYHIHVDADGLLVAGEPGVQLPWMDARFGDRPVTPRQGKAVEINALWVNALQIVADLMLQSGAGSAAAKYRERAERVKQRFNEVFWNEQDQCLYDVVEGERREAAIRPNQIFALSLPFPLLSDARAASVLRIVEEQLLTPYGLRSLAPGHPDYRPHCGGDPSSRDCTYHQGTVWGWLSGPFITALVRLKGPAGKAQAKTIIENLSGHLNDAGIGSISEIFDADPPHTPRGCIAQAGSVAEVLRAYLEDVW